MESTMEDTYSLLGKLAAACWEKDAVTMDEIIKKRSKGTLGAAVTSKRKTIRNKDRVTDPLAEKANLEPLVQAIAKIPESPSPTLGKREEPVDEELAAANRATPSVFGAIGPRHPEPEHFDPRKEQIPDNKHPLVVQHKFRPGVIDVEYEPAQPKPPKPPKQLGYERKQLGYTPDKQPVQSQSFDAVAGPPSTALSTFTAAAPPGPIAKAEPVDNGPSQDEIRQFLKSVADPNEFMRMDENGQLVLKSRAEQADYRRLWPDAQQPEEPREPGMLRNTGSYMGSRLRDLLQKLREDSRSNFGSESKEKKQESGKDEKKKPVKYDPIDTHHISKRYLERGSEGEGAIDVKKTTAKDDLQSMLYGRLMKDRLSSKSKSYGRTLPESAKLDFS